MRSLLLEMWREHETCTGKLVLLFWISSSFWHLHLFYVSKPVMSFWCFLSWWTYSLLMVVNNEFHLHSPSMFLLRLPANASYLTCHLFPPLFRACLELVPHKKFSFAKIWLLAAQFEIRQLNLKGARQILGNAIGKASKDKVNTWLKVYLPVKGSA